MCGDSSSLPQPEVARCQPWEFTLVFFRHQSSKERRSVAPAHLTGVCVGIMNQCLQTLGNVGQKWRRESIQTGAEFADPPSEPTTETAASVAAQIQEHPPDQMALFSLQKEKLPLESCCSHWWQFSFWMASLVGANGDSFFASACSFFR